MRIKKKKEYPYGFIHRIQTKELLFEECPDLHLTGKQMLEMIHTFAREFKLNKICNSKRVFVKNGNISKS